MQALLQYRRLRANVQSQWEQGALSSKNNTPPSQSPPSQSLDREEDLRHELETSLSRHTSLPEQYNPEAPIDPPSRTRTRLSSREVSRIRSHATRTDHEDEPVFLVGWDGEEDPMNPQNYGTMKRVGLTLIIASIAALVGAAGSIDSAILPLAAEEFGVSEVTESLATGIFLIGFGVGALTTGPFSEAFGRSAVYISTLILFAIWEMAAALAPNIGAQLAFRFLAGFFGSTPLTCAGGSMADLWNPIEKTYGFPIFAIGGFGGPVLGPVMGSYIGISELRSWRWTEWIILIAAGLVTCIVVLFLPETFSPMILRWKAQHLRNITGDSRYKSPMEVQGTTLGQRIRVALTRPFILVWSEPIIILMTLYMSVLYIVLFTFLDGYTYIFHDVYGTSEGLTNIIFVAMFVGMLLCSFLVWPLYLKTVKTLEKNTSRGSPHLHPEVRLWFAMLGGAVGVPVSLFWMGWTDYSSVSIWSPIIASTLFGYGVIVIFVSAYMYIIDSYEIYAASALVFITLVRYTVAGGMVVVGIPFYRNMGTHWTLTILGAISAVLCPIPYVFYRYGHRIRKLSKYAVTKQAAGDEEKA